MERSHTYTYYIVVNITEIIRNHERSLEENVIAIVQLYLYIRKYR